MTKSKEFITSLQEPVLSKSKYKVELEKVFNKKQYLQFWILIVLWAWVNYVFWKWWIQPQNVSDLTLYILITFGLFYNTTLLPTFYLFYLGNMRKPKHVDAALAVRARIVKKVAMIALTVPSAENLDIVEKQIKAMLNVKFPHDTWIVVDREHSETIKQMAESFGANYFCRVDTKTWGKAQVKKWTQNIPPFKAKTKAGNVNAWLDMYGRNYSHFTQLDIDHIPQPDYLDEVLGYFLDKEVAWVQAPSVYGNFESWTAQGSAEQELVLQGPMQMGFFGFCRTPFIIGSHSTYDTKSILKIGGFQPTRAEDHLDTVFLAALGKQGVFHPEVIAVGDGPENFETYLSQQFAWAYSMMQVLFNYTPKCVKNYTLKQSIQFLFVQSWYTLYSTSLLVLFLLPIVCLLTNKAISNVDYWDFTLRYLPIGFVALLAWIWSKKWHKPSNVGLTWRGIVLYMARWPIVLSAFAQVLLKIEKPYMLTVKGMHKGNERPFGLKTQMPYFALIAVSIGACWYYIVNTDHSMAQGYLLFAIQGALFMMVVYATALFCDIKEMRGQGVSELGTLKARSVPAALLALVVGILVYTSTASMGRIGEAIFYNSSRGAGLGAVFNNQPDVILSGYVAGGPRYKANIILASTSLDKGERSINLTAAPEQYHVVNGDTLWTIAYAHYGDGIMWYRIRDINAMESTVIRPGDTLVLD